MVLQQGPQSDADRLGYLVLAFRVSVDHSGSIRGASGGAEGAENRKGLRAQLDILMKMGDGYAAHVCCLGAP